MPDTLLGSRGRAVNKREKVPAPQSLRSNGAKKERKKKMDFSGGPVVKNPPANAGDMGSILDPGRSLMPQGN